MSWRVDSYKISPSQWAYKEFEAWAEQAEADRHLQPGQAKHIVQIFDGALNAMDQRASLGVSLDGPTSKGLIRRGTRVQIEHKAREIFHHWRELRQQAQRRAPQQGAPVRRSQGTYIDIGGIQRAARQHGFVWFYKAPENTLTQCFGNYFESGTRVLGCATSEGAFLAQKYGYNLLARHPFTDLTGDDLYRENLNQQSLGRQVPGWVQGGNEVAMRAVLADKFAPGTPLAAALLATGQAYLVEHNPVKGRDDVWSDNHDGSGQNKLGRLLMERRGVLGGFGDIPPPASYLSNPSSLK